MTHSQFAKTWIFGPFPCFLVESRGLDFDLFDPFQSLHDLRLPDSYACARMRPVRLGWTGGEGEMDQPGPTFVWVYKRYLPTHTWYVYIYIHIYIYVYIYILSSSLVVFHLEVEHHLSRSMIPSSTETLFFPALSRRFRAGIYHRWPDTHDRCSDLLEGWWKLLGPSCLGL